MLSMSVHQGMKGSIRCPPSLPCQNPNVSVGVFKTPCPLKLHRNSSSLQFKSSMERFDRISANSAAVEETLVTETQQQDQVKEEVKRIEKPRLVLKFIWMEKNIGVGVDQVIGGGHGSIPLSPYFFWPRKDAWEELKTTLESKPWISQKKMIILLNQATDIINLWQQSGGNLNS